MNRWRRKRRTAGGDLPGLHDVTARQTWVEASNSAENCPAPQPLPAVHCASLVGVAWVKIACGLLQVDTGWQKRFREEVGTTDHCDAVQVVQGTHERTLELFV